MEENEFNSILNGLKTEGVNIPNISSSLMNEIMNIADKDDSTGRAFSEINSDAIVQIIVNSKKLEASICVHAPQGRGSHVTREMVDEAIEKSRVSFGINQAILNDIINERMYDELFPFASGIPAVEGVNGYVQNRFSQIKKLVPKLREDGTVDYRDLGMVNNISIGDVICDITNETKGEDGTNVYGETIPALPGKPPVISSGANTGLNGDKTKLIALASGNLIFKNGKFMVDTVFNLNGDVGAGVGNINFLGDVTIKGNVLEGFSVKAGKNIIIEGSVSSATLEAGGSIVVRQGVMNTKITAVGRVSVDFAENTSITCNEAFTANSLVACTVTVEGNIDCTGKPGVIIGGEIKAVGNVKCNQIGHKSYISTTLSVGNFALLLSEKEKLKRELEQIDENIQQLETAIKFLQEKKKNGVKIGEDKENFLAAALRLKVQKAVSKNPMLRRIVEIDAKMTKSDDYTLRAYKNIFPNCKISMGNFVMNTTTELGSCFLYTDKQGIQVGH